MPTINPCPFCGSEDVVLRGGLDYSWVYCDDCEACGPTGFGENKKMADMSAIEKWNNSKQGEVRT